MFIYARAVRLREVEEYKDSIQAYGLVVRRVPDFAGAYHGRGLSYYHDGQLEFALEDFDRAIELKPDFADAYKSRAVLYKDQGDTDMAIADLEQALSLYDRVRDGAKIVEARTLLRELKR